MSTTNISASFRYFVHLKKPHLQQNKVVSLSLSLYLFYTAAGKHRYIVDKTKGSKKAKKFIFCMLYKHAKCFYNNQTLWNYLQSRYICICPLGKYKAMIKLRQRMFYKIVIFKEGLFYNGSFNKLAKKKPIY